MRIHSQRKLDVAQISDVIVLYREGWNTGQLARRYGVSKEAIRGLLRRRGVEMRARWPKGASGEGKPYTDRMTRLEERDSAGIIVTLRNQRTGALHSMHVHGLRTDALRWTAEKVDRLADDWRLLCYSTPATIQGDITGKRAITPEAKTRKARSKELGYLYPVEAMVLARIGRLDLLDPSIPLTKPREKKK